VFVYWAVAKSSRWVRGWVIVSRAALDLYTVRKNEHSIVDSLYLYIMPTDTFENPWEFYFYLKKKINYKSRISEVM
jgi:hypothetical protein